MTSFVVLSSQARFVLLNARTRQMPHPNTQKATAFSRARDVTTSKRSPSSDAIFIEFFKNVFPIYFCYKFN